MPCRQVRTRDTSWLDSNELSLFETFAFNRPETSGLPLTRTDILLSYQGLPAPEDEKENAVPELAPEDGDEQELVAEA